jgi:arylsulfatase A-like enzyme
VRLRGPAARTLLLGAAILAVAGCGGSVPRTSRVLLVTFDTTRADRLGCYGYADAATPVLDGLAREGVLFEQAVSPVPTTLPSHSTMFTGLYPQDHGVRYNILYRLAPAADTLAEALSGAGFATAGFPAAAVVSKRFGIDQGFETWVDPPAPENAARVSTHPHGSSRLAGDGVDLAIDWFAKHADRDAFVWLHFYDPHWPYAPPFPYSSKYRDRPYDGEIAYADAQLGRLLDVLRNDGRWDETLVIVAGDHGEGLYDHNERYHSTLIYESTQHVPLIVRAPGATVGRIAEPVTLADLMPTVLDLTGVEGPTALRGISLRPALEGGNVPPRDVYFESLTGAINYGWAELFGVRYGDWKLIDSNEPELYNLADDPHEANNLVDYEPDRLAELRGALDVIGEPLDVGGASEAELDTLDEETEAMLTSLGYVAGGAQAGRSADAPHPKRFIDLEPEMLDAQGAMARGDYAAVEDTSSYVLSRDPTNVWALGMLSKALLNLDRPLDALTPQRRLVELDPDNERFLVDLATVYRRLGRTEDVLETLDTAVEAHPDSERLHYLQLVARLEGGEGEVCETPIREAVERFPESSRIAVLEARCAARRDDLSGAMSAIGRAVELGFERLEFFEENEEFAKVVSTDVFREFASAVRARLAAEDEDEDDADAS